MKTLTPAQSCEKQFIELKVSKLEAALQHIRTKIQLHSSYSSIQHLLDKEKELTYMLEDTRKQFLI